MRDREALIDMTSKEQKAVSDDAQKENRHIKEYLFSKKERRKEGKVEDGILLNSQTKNRRGKKDNYVRNQVTHPVKVLCCLLLSLKHLLYLQ